jgi:hypothetical protein
VSLTLLLLSISGSAIAQTKCDTALNACIKALDARTEQVQALDLALTESRKEADSLRASGREKDEQLSAWYRNPFVMMALGLVAGVAVTR